MTRFRLDYDEYLYDEEDLLEALFDKEALDEALEETRDPNTYKTEFLLTSNNGYIVAVYYYNATTN